MVDGKLEVNRREKKKREKGSKEKEKIDRQVNCQTGQASGEKDCQGYTLGEHVPGYRTSIGEKPESEKA